VTVGVLCCIGIVAAATSRVSEEKRELVSARHGPPGLYSDPLAVISVGIPILLVTLAVGTFYPPAIPILLFIAVYYCGIRAVTTGAGHY